jgi:hypothetical protein
MELPEFWRQPDEDIGWWLIATWMGHQAQKEGFALNAIPEEWAIRLIERTAVIDTDSISNAPLESAFRKACAGDMATAGRMLRDYCLQGAREIVNAKYAVIGIKGAIGRKTGNEKSVASKKKDADERHAPMVKQARDLLNQGKNRRDLPSILADKFGIDSTTVRRALKKAGIR